MSHKITEWNGEYGDCPTCGVVKVYVKESRGKMYASCSVKSKSEAKSNRKTNTNKNANLVRKYNISLLEYEEMMEEQGGRCAICKRTTDKFVVDHDHACCPGDKSCGDCVRGLLCNPCNLMLGFAGDSLKVLDEAINYLRASQGAQYEG